MATRQHFQLDRPMAVLRLTRASECYMAISPHLPFLVEGEKSSLPFREF